MGMGNFASPEAHAHAHFFPFQQPFAGIPQLKAQMMIIRFGFDLDFFDFDLRLVLPGFPFFTLLFVLELAKIHHFTHRRIRFRRNLYQVYPAFLGNFERPFQRDNPKIDGFAISLIVVLFYNQTNLSRSYLPIDAIL